MPKHGTEHMYLNHKCRCDRCKKAAARARNHRRWDANRRLKAGEVTVVHGKTSTYTYWGCRCEECREAMRVYYRDLRDRKARGVKLSKRGRKPSGNATPKPVARKKPARIPQPVTLSPPAATGRFRRLRDLIRA